MRKVLIVASLFVSVIVNSQQTNPILNMQHPPPKLGHNVAERIKDRSDANFQFASTFFENTDIKKQTDFQKPLIQIYDSIYRWYWNNDVDDWDFFEKSINFVYANNNQLGYDNQTFNGGVWTISSKCIKTYDVNNNHLSTTLQNWSNNTWVTQSIWSWTYDENNNLTSDILETWLDGVWMKEQERTLTYDNNNNVTNIMVLYWGDGDLVGSHLFNNYDSNNKLLSCYYMGLMDGVWSNVSQYLYLYDGNSNMTNETYQMWSGAEWINSEQIFYTRDSFNSLENELKQNWINNEWKNSKQVNYFYNVNSNLEIKLGQIWSTGLWQDSYQFIYSYDANYNMLESKKQQWNDSLWLNSVKTVYAFDDNNYQTMMLVQNWTDSVWKDYYYYTYILDDNGFTIGESRKFWPNNNFTTMSGDSSHYFYHTVLGEDEIMIKDEHIRVYPNPCNGRFKVSSENSILSIEVFNLFGERIYFEFLTNQQTSKEIDLSNQERGIYILKLHSDDNIFTQKIVIQ